MFKAGIPDTKALEKEILRRNNIIHVHGFNTVSDYRQWHYAEIEKYEGIQRKNFLETYPYLPELFIIIEDFPRASSIQPDFLKNISLICAKSKHLGINLLLVNQTFDNPKCTNMLNLQYFIALQTNSTNDSLALIGNPNANYISYEPGIAYIRYFDKKSHNTAEKEEKIKKIKKIKFNYCGKDNHNQYNN